MENGVQQKVDIEILKERVETHDKFIEKMETNHLPHIYSRLGKIEQKIAWYSGATIAAISIIQWIISYFIK